MKSNVPKVLHRVGGRALVEHVLSAARAAGCGRILVIVGHGGDEVREALLGAEVEFVEQAEQRGTGHALSLIREVVDPDDLLIVLSGDAPLIRAGTLRRLIAAAAEGWGALATAELERPGALGRIVRDADGELERIVEAADASVEELAVREVNAGFYALPAAQLFEYLAGLHPDNAKAELYLTDALGAAVQDGRGIAIVGIEDSDEALGVNTRSDLARVQEALWSRKAHALMAAGVTLLDPASARIDPEVEIGRDSVIHPSVTLLGATRIASRCELATGAWLRDAELDTEVRIEPYSVLDGCRIGAGCRVGPFARLRPGTVLERGARIGNFVEIKNSRLGPGVKAGHLTYLGDADIGEKSNIGAGVITCNYDGVSKHETRIGRQAFIGSDTMLVAPVDVGDRATTGAGSAITQDVPADALAVERSRQRNVADWKKRKGARGEERGARGEEPRAGGREPAAEGESGERGD
jgi:bifunctional UDP-N-acetylglucosamine pyrophosphorylase/glucosamine-1-phosphate N-acetyltransferase